MTPPQSDQASSDSGFGEMMTANSKSSESPLIRLSPDSRRQEQPTVLRTSLGPVYSVATLRQRLPMKELERECKTGQVDGQEDDSSDKTEKCCDIMGCFINKKN